MIWVAIEIRSRVMWGWSLKVDQSDMGWSLKVGQSDMGWSLKVGQSDVGLVIESRSE